MASPHRPRRKPGPKAQRRNPYPVADDGAAVARAITARELDAHERVLDAADAAILSAIEHDLLRPAVVEAALDTAVAALTTPVQGADARQHELDTIDAELRRYAAAIGTAGSLEEILAEIKKREERRAALRAEATPRLAPPDRAALKRDLQARLADWRALLRAQVAEGRAILAKLLAGRLRFTPEEAEDGRYYAFTGQGTLTEILAGTLLQEYGDPGRSRPL